MATKPSPAKSRPRARKSTGPTPVDSPSASRTGTNAGQPWLPDLGEVFKQMKLPGVDMQDLLEARRRDVEALVEANQHMVEGMRALAARQTELAQETFREWQSALQSAQQGRPEAHFGAQSELAQKAFAKALGNLRELAELAADSQSRVFKIMQKRSAENLEEMRRLMKPK